MEGKNKMMMIIIIVLLIVLIGAVVGLALFSMQAMKNNTEQETTSNLTVEKVVQLTQEDVTLVKLSSPIVTNLRVGTDGMEHEIRVSLAYDVNKKEKSSAALITMLAEKEEVVRAFALEVIHTKTYQELRRPDGGEILKNEILVKLQEEFNTNLIVNVYISDVLYY